MGHGGTLDKAASGVLVVGINKGCSKLPAFLGGQKGYVTTCQFGRATDTYNKEGNTTFEKPYSHITARKVETALSNFHGKKLQRPPLYSALKYKGQRLSDLARSGVIVEPEPRYVHCYKTTLLDFRLPFLTFSLVCGGGFYVRSMVHDLGLALDSCAHIIDLERIQQGPFQLHDCLRERQISTISIVSKIEELESITRSYLDKEMTKFKIMSNQWEYKK